MITEIKTVTITEKGQIVIPKSFRESHYFKEGEKIAIISFKDRIELRPLLKVSEKMETAYASEKVLSKDWKTSKEDKAWKNL
jgi:AbrB family looped-hinge helix DNA binding protein